jgi:hypothetical protein
MASSLTAQRSNPGRKEFFTHVQTDCGVHIASYTMVTRSFPEVKWPGRGVDHPTTSSANVKDRVELHNYTTLWTSMTGYSVDFTVPCHH